MTLFCPQRNADPTGFLPPSFLAASPPQHISAPGIPRIRPRWLLHRLIATNLLGVFKSPLVMEDPLQTAFNCRQLLKHLLCGGHWIHLLQFPGLMSGLLPAGVDRCASTPSWVSSGGVCPGFLPPCSKPHQRRGLEQQKSILHSSGGQKTHFKVSEGWFPLEALRKHLFHFSSSWRWL